MDVSKKQWLRRWRVVVGGFNTVDHVLRRRNMRGSSASGVVPWWRVTALVMTCGPVCGFGIGSYNYVMGHTTFAQQFPQMVYSAIKMPLLIAMTLVIALPSFFVINSLLGLRDDFMAALRGIVSAQAGLTIILASLLPLTLFSYVALATFNASYSLAVLFNAAMFGLASISAQVLLRGYYSPLIQRDPKHRLLVRLWIFVYAFVGIQAAYTMRPFIGSPGKPTTFFRTESFENAYVKIFELINNVLHNGPDY